MAAADLALEKGLPVNVDAERLVLGSILLDEALFVQVAGLLQAGDFALEKHRRIFSRMAELHERGEKIDRITVYNELLKHNEAEACDGLTYLVSLDDGLPRISNIDAYVRIVRDKALLRRMIFSAQKLIDRCLLAEEDPEEILLGAEETLLRLGDDRSRSALITPDEIIRDHEGGVSTFLDPSKRIHGLSTGFLKLDEMTGGLHGGELFILAARPAMGKTAMALNIAQHISMGKEPKAVAVFSLEMSKESLLTRMLCTAARVDSQKFRAGFLNAEERRRLVAAANALADAPLFIDDTAGANLMDIHAKLRRLKAEHGLALVVLDYLQLMSVPGRVENRNQEISKLSRGLKLLAKELNVPIMVLSQLSRAPEMRQGDRRPQLSDLRDSGSIEQDADLVAFIFREEVYKPERQDLRGVSELILAKQRNGPSGIVKLAFLKHCTKFENLTSDFEEGTQSPPEEE
ncbi:MAG: replicative DNA helicase [Bryobacteraceae bacterium]